MRIFIIVFTLLITALHSAAQVPTEAMARAELQKRGIDEQQFIDEMLKRGIDINNIDISNPAELTRIEAEVKSAIEFLENKNKNTGTPPPVEDQPETNRTNPLPVQKPQTPDATKQQSNITKTEQKPDTNAIYGHHLFNKNNLGLYNASDNIKPPKTYVVGPGDVISVSIWGTSQANFSLEVSKDGYIQPSELPRYYVGGLTVDAVEKLLFSGLSRRFFFKRENFEVAVVSPRNVTISIFGEVITSGTFTISALNSAFNAIVASGGLRENASIRNISLVRPGEKTRKLDVYQLIENAGITADFYLKDNDIIHIPQASKVVSIRGGVRRPFKFELLEQEGIIELLKYAGGTTANAITSRLQVRRINDGRVNILDVNLDQLQKNAGNFMLQDGDEITVITSNINYENVISVAGAVEIDGEFAIAEEMRISDVLKMARPLETAILETAYLRKLNPDKRTVRYSIINLKAALENPGSDSDPLVDFGDFLTIRSASDFKELKTFKIEGAVRIPGEYALSESENLFSSDAIFLAGGLMDQSAAFAYIFREDPKDNKTREYLYIDLNKVLSNPRSGNDISLKPGDSLVVYSNYSFTDRVYVKVNGAVRNPGEFSFHPSLTLQDLLLLSGGLRVEAAPNRIEIYRLKLDPLHNTKTELITIKLNNEDEVAKTQGVAIQPFDQIFVRYAPEFEFQRMVSLTGEVKYPGDYALIKKNTRLIDLIFQAGGLTEESDVLAVSLYRNDRNIGPVVIDMEKALKDPKSEANLILLPGDEIFIPKVNSVISITGAANYREIYSEKLITANKINVAYRKNKSADYYVKEFAGGFHDDADRSNLMVVHPNGKIVKTSKFLFFRSYPTVPEGGIIEIPFKKPKVQKSGDTNEKDIKWGEILANSIAQATAVLSLILLLQRID